MHEQTRCPELSPSSSNCCSSRQKKHGACINHTAQERSHNPYYSQQESFIHQGYYNMIDLRPHKCVRLAVTLKLLALKSTAHCPVLKDAS